MEGNLMEKPVQLIGETRERVAYDLMVLISRYESNQSQYKSPDYWLDLYHDCLVTVNYGRSKRNQKRNEHDL